MSTYREVVHMVMDKLKISSDDSYFTTDHVMFLIDKYRAMFLKKVYNTAGKELPESYYQTLCLDLEVTDEVPGLPCDGKVLRSVKPIPQMIPRGDKYLYVDGYFGASFSFVSRERMRHVGHDRWRRNAIYCALGPDQHLYFRSANPQHLYLKGVKLKAVFEDYKEALGLSCDEDDTDVCDPLDGRVRMEEAYMPLIIDSVFNELALTVYKPSDPFNNAADDMPRIGMAGKEATSAGAQADDVE